MAHSHSTAAAITGVSVALFFIHFAGTSGWGYAQAVSSASHVAATSALQNFAGFLIASAAPVITGFLVDRTHSFELALLICSGITGLGALSYATLAAPRRTLNSGRVCGLSVCVHAGFRACGSLAQFGDQRERESFFRGVVDVFARTDSLGVVDASVSGEKVADHTGDSGVGTGLGAKQFYREKGGCDGSVCGAGEDGCKAHGSQQGWRQRQEVSEGVAEGGPDVEQRSHFATLEASAQSDGGEEGLRRRSRREPLWR